MPVLPANDPYAYNVAQVKVLWVLNAQQSAWEKKLPTQVSQLLAATRKQLKRADLQQAGLTSAAVKGGCMGTLGAA
jgi:hypothetical protein